ncbi:putative phosphoenolpyruvate synthase-like protein [Leptotrombidium deliense]|uniref:Putative phosphoenolpyruvate synthase-like protein n=1 Tax=Leptotrombidium deliense TaxID=299467 RepID=A0A443RZB3_9ACAR|nr:putative phosphoenolpyruvate synthase-like protein [Leptotrombidium deliense]
MFSAFLKEHGHRGYMEWDIMVPQWEQDPLPIVKVLKNMNDGQANNFEKKQLSIDDMLQSLKSNISSSNKYKLRKLWIPLSQKAIGFREQSKSLLSAHFNRYRNAFSKLAELMVNEGRIPSTDLIYFLTIEEVYRLTFERESTLVAHAKQRMKHFTKLNAMQFNLIIKGVDVKPINFDTKLEPIAKGEIVCGTAVCSGKVTARATVAKTIHDVNLIQATF